MSKTRIFLLTAIIAGFAFFSPLKLTASVHSCNKVVITDAVSFDSEDTRHTVSSNFTPPDTTRKKKIVSALFALPFPCGFMGTHRVMLGTSPWVPVVYVATFGGCFGLLPLIDFCVIAFSKDITPYENNPHVFMWIK